MKAFHILSALAIFCYLPLAEGALYQYVFTGTIESAIPSSEDSSISISAPISGILTLDVTGTGDSDLLIPENFASTAADLQLLIGKSIRVSAVETKLSGHFSSGSSKAESAAALVAFSPENIVNSDAGSFPAILTVARRDALSSSQEMPLSGLDVSFNAALLGSLELGDETSGGLSGSFNFGEGSEAQKINFAATNIQRKNPETISPSIRREWNSLQAHVASLGLMEAIDDVTFQNFNPDDLDLIEAPIPEPASLTAVLGLFALFAAARRKR